MALIQHATYVGRVKSLKGKTALVQDAEGGGFNAQFDDRGTDQKPNPLAFGWHWFGPRDFKIDPAYEDEGKQCQT